MTRLRFHDFVFIAGIAVLAATLSIAQERPYRPTHGWHVWTLQPSDGGWNPVRVDVVETSGACLYIARTWAGQAAIAAVPRTTLPVGAGCQ